MSDYNSLEQIRLQKIIDLREAGVEPYPTRASRTHTTAKAISTFENAEAAANGGQIEEIKVTLTGRIRATRAMGKLTLSLIHI